MTTRVGAHVHPWGHPEVDLTVDVVAHLADGHEVYRAHDSAGHTVYLFGEDAEPDSPEGS